MTRPISISSLLIGIMVLLASSCVHEFPVTDYSFDFSAQVVYDENADLHRLTLTKVSGPEKENYKISFTLDGEASVSLTDMTGRVYDSPITESFDGVSTKTYTLSKLQPGEHTLTLDIKTEEFSISLSEVFVVEDFSFDFDTKIIFDEKTKTHSLELTLIDGAPTDTYTITYTVDNKEPRKTYQETFTDDIIKTYTLSVEEPGEHTINLLIRTAKHSQKADLPYIVNDYSFQVKADIEYDREDLSHILFLTLMRGSRDEIYTISYTVDGGHSVKLTDISGKELGASFSENFKDATVHSYGLSRAEKGSHTMKMIVSTKD